MPRNGSGQYSAPTNSWNPAINGVPATAADWQAVLNDIVSALTQSVSRDGQTAMTGNLPMAGNKVTGLGNATATGDALTFAQLFSQGQQQDVPAAATTDIGAQLSTLINVTGAATITSFGTNYNGPRFLRFAGVCTLINSATLVLPGGANITTAAGDSCIAVPLGNPATGWRVAGLGNVSTTGDQTIGGTKTFTGNVGIGTASPGARLSVLTDSIYAASFNTTTEVSSTTGIAIGGFSTAAPGGGGSVVIRAHHNHTATAASSMSFMTNNGSSLSEGMRIDSAGNVTATGNITAGGQFIGNGAGLTNVPASAIAGALNASGSAPIYACRAWVNFNGAGTVAIRGGGNVSSITDNGVGDYTVNFTTAMPAANYAVCGVCDGVDIANGNMILAVYPGGLSTSGARITCTSGGSTVRVDQPIVSVAIFR